MNRTKLFVFLVLISFSCSIACFADAEINKTEIALSHDMDDATRINTGELYYTNNEGWWAKFKTDEAGIYGLYTRKITGKICVFVYTQFREEIAWAYSINEKEPQHVSFDLDANKTYYLFVVNTKDLNGPVFATAGGEFSICSPQAHIELMKGVDVSAPTCTVDGIIGDQCSYCHGVLNERKVAANGHKNGNWKVRVPAGCEQDGLMEQRCSICDELLSEDEIPATGHTEGEMKTILEPTCIQTGVNAVQCTICNTVLSKESIPITDHAPGVMSVAKPATCTEDGLNEQRCKVCNILLDSEITAAQGHKPGEWRETNDPSCTTVGIKAQECTVCSLRLGSEIVPAYGHTPGDWRVTIRSSAFSSGERVQKCDVCHEQIAVEEIPAAISKVLIFGLIASVGAALVMTILFVTKAKKNK